MLKLVDAYGYQPERRVAKTRSDKKEMLFGKIVTKQTP